MGSGDDMTAGARKAIRTLRLAVAFLLIVVGLLVAHQLGESARIARVVEHNNDSTCAFWRDLATLPLSDRAGETSFRIVADGRAAYIKNGCPRHHGTLPPPDPRVAPFLPPGVR